MLARSLLRRSAATLSRSYATHAPDGLPPVPKSATIKTSEYDPADEPALADMKYPKMYEESRQLRQNPFQYWDKQERVNFGEPVRLSFTHFASRRCLALGPPQADWCILFVHRSP